MKALADYTLTQAVEFIVDDIVKDKGISKVLAKKLVTNALLYSCVTEEVKGQVDFLLDDDYEPIEKCIMVNIELTK